MRRFSRSDLPGLGLSRETDLALESSLEVIELLDRKIHQIERAVLRATKPWPELKLLRTVAGIGQTLGLTILLETGEISRFRSVKNYVSYARLVKTERRSNDRKKGEGNRKNGNP